MFIIPGFVISILTFPGIIVHEWSHKKFCEWFHIRVHSVKYFSLNKTAGYVIHDIPTKYNQIFWISVGPLLTNSLLTLFISFIASQAIKESYLWGFLLWLGYSVGMHSFPSDTDMQHILNASKKELNQGGSVLHYLAFFLVGLIWILNKLRFFWFDLIYAVILVYLGGGFQ